MPHSSSNAIAGANEKHEHVYSVASSTDGSFSYAVCFKKNVAFFFGYLARRGWKREEPRERNVSLKCVVTSTYFTRRKNRLNALCECYDRCRQAYPKTPVISTFRFWDKHGKVSTFLFFLDIIRVTRIISLTFSALHDLLKYEKEKVTVRRKTTWFLEPTWKKEFGRWLKRGRKTSRSRWAFIVSYLARVKAIGRILVAVISGTEIDAY